MLLSGFVQYGCVAHRRYTPVAYSRDEQEDDDRQAVALLSCVATCDTFWGCDISMSHAITSFEPSVERIVEQGDDGKTPTPSKPLNSEPWYLLTEEEAPNA